MACVVEARDEGIEEKPFIGDRVAIAFALESVCLVVPLSLRKRQNTKSSSSLFQRRHDVPRNPVITMGREHRFRPTPVRVTS